MNRVFVGAAGSESHGQFQKWRRTHPHGFVIALQTRSRGMLHRTKCRHFGDTKWVAGVGGSLTNKTKVGSDSSEELRAWAAENGVSLRDCSDCAIPTKSADYVAYHSERTMGRKYGAPTKRFAFLSGKAATYLRRAIACRVWVIASTVSGSDTRYWFAGMYKPDAVLDRHGSRIIQGEGRPVDPLVEVTTLPWFKRLFREQNRFSYGFNRIRSQSIVAELERLIGLGTGKPAMASDPPSASSFVEGANRRVNANRIERDPRARRECIQHHGCGCTVCGFEFGVVYGERGRGFIHVHHLRALSKAGGSQDTNPVTDMRPVCPNCHAMIHRDAEMITIQKLKTLVRTQSRIVERAESRRSAGGTKQTPSAAKASR